MAAVIQQRSKNPYEGEKGTFPYGRTLDNGKQLIKGRMVEFFTTLPGLQMEEPSLEICDDGSLLIQDATTKLPIEVTYDCTPTPAIRLPQRFPPAVDENGLLTFSLSLWGKSKPGANIQMKIFTAEKKQLLAEGAFQICAKITSASNRGIRDEVTRAHASRRKMRSRAGKARPAVHRRRVDYKTKKAVSRRRRTPSWSDEEDDPSSSTDVDDSQSPPPSPPPSLNTVLTRAERYRLRNKDAAATDDQLPFLTADDVEFVFGVLFGEN
jgi:hypothetical protein